MTGPDERDREIARLRDRLSRLSEAGLRIMEDLDFNTVLQGVLDSARSLTGARYGIIVLHAGSGIAEPSLSSGITEDEMERLRALPGGREHFQHLAAIAGPLRVADLGGHIRSLGLPEMVYPLAVSDRASFMVTPVLHRGERVGSILLAEKERAEEFTQEDEETLVLFASQAALAIANARRHREERRARADLETLIDISPAGVAIVDAATGAVKFVNREALRIGDRLRSPDQTMEDVLEVLTFRRADGAEVSLREFSMAELQCAAETMRAEEVVISVPDGRSVTLLINATLIVSDEGVIDSVVVAIQDMADIEKQERLRAEFLAMVSHELTIPLTSIKGSAATIMDSGAELDPALVRQFVRIIGDQADHLNALVADLLDVARIETGTLPVRPEPAQVDVLVDRARNSFTNAGGRNNLAIDVETDLPLVMADRRRIVQVLTNLLSNAARNSPESSAITVSAVRDGIHVSVSVADEGRGIPAESLPNLFRKFSGAQPDERGGDTGLGLAICKGIVEAHGGRIWAESDGPEAGARFTFTLPSVEDSPSGSAGRLPPPSTRRDQDKKGERRRRVLAVDDNPNDLRYLRDILARSGFDPILAEGPDEALRLVADERPELVLLDMMMPGTNGIELMKEILDTADVPVIFLSAYGREELIAKALDTGATDYVVKPFSQTELSARIRAALRRRAAEEPSEPYVLGELTIDYAGRSVTLAGRGVHLTPIEYRLLAELSANAGRVLTYKHLLRRVWGEPSDGDRRPMRTIVNQLRRKLGDNADNPTYIFTEPRVGYCMPKAQERSPEA